MGKENRRPQVGSRHGLSVVRHVTQTARLMSEQARLSPADFLSKYSIATREAFPGSLDGAVANRAVPVLICARNEEQTIGATLHGLSRSTTPVQPILVDNGSTDQTAEIARSMGAEVISEEKPGLPNALRAGFSFFLQRDYHGPILHTEADSVPLPTWASTMVRFTQRSFPNGGHAYGRILHYDGMRRAYKNGVLSAGRRVRNVMEERKGITPVHGCNDIIVTGNDDRILFALAHLLEPITMSTDRAVRAADLASGKPQATCKEPAALVLTSGRRHEKLRDVFKATWHRKNVQKTYRERMDTAND